jgi:hypothetical protein
MFKLALLCWLGLVLLGQRADAALQINELVTRNDSTLADEDGDYPDWIELRNPDTAALNLAGYGLSDDPARPFKWVFPARILSAGGYLIVFASNKDRTNGVTLHANFALNAEGESLLLTRPDGTLLDGTTFGLLPSDYALGRPVGNTGAWWYFPRATPGAANTSPGYAALLPPPAFSAPGGFYESDFALSITAPAEGTVRYTLDGSEPSTNSPVYSTPLSLRDRSPETNGISMLSGTSTVNQHTDGWFPPNGLVQKCTVVRARLFRADAPPGPVATATYWLGTNAAQRYTLPVLSIATANSGLFDYTNGIYMLGLIFDQYRAAHPTEPLTGHTPANYTQRGKAWERAAHLEWYVPGGATGFAQNVKIDIQGQSSRSFREKSLGIKARSDQSPLDAIDYPVFPGLTNRLGQPISHLKSLRLRNSGNDWAYTMFRDELCHRLIAGTEVDGQSYTPVVTFLNGEYWGLLNAREQEDEDYLADHYDVAPETVTICETIGTLLHGRPGDNQHFVNLRSFVDTNDLAVGTNYDYVRTQMDVVNFMNYQAAEIYFANADWPHNNIRFWRVPVPQFQPEAPLGQDGRWRWLLFDVDLGMSHPWSGGYGDNTLSAALSPTGRPGLNAPWSTALLRGLVRNPDFRNEFINTLADHLNTTFKENRVTDVIDGIYNTLAPAMPEHIRRWRAMGDTFSGWSNNVRSLRLFASQRPINVRQHIVAQFGLGGFATLTLNVTPAARGYVRVNRMQIDATTPGVTNNAPYPWRGTYFRGVPVRLQAVPAPGSMFAGWSGRPDLGTNASVLVTLTNNLSLTAAFQPSPPPFDLSTGPYRFTAWDAAAPAGTYPPHMRFQQTSNRDPALATPLESDWRWAYSLTNRSRLLGLAEEGLSFLNTSSAQDFPGAGYLGAALVALRTTGVTNIEVSWLGGTLLPNQQAYALRLQYAIGDGPFRDVLDSSGSPVEYLRNATTGHQQLLGPVVLPADAEHQDYLQLRWKYYFVAGTSGQRAQLRLDDILVTRQPAPMSPRLGTLQFQPDGAPLLRFDGLPHRTYALETSTNLVTWSPLPPLTTDIDGLGRSAGLPAAWGLDAARFFRVGSTESGH